MRRSPFAVLLVLAAGPAAAQDTAYYAKLFGGFSSLQGSSADLGGSSQLLSYDGGSIYGGAFGYDYGDRPFRAELEFSYRTDEAKGAVGGDYASTTFIVNGYYLFSRGTLTPYAGLGLGYVTEVDFDVTSGPGTGEYSDRGLFAWQLIFGADYAISDSLSLFGEARYFAAETATLDGPGGVTLSADYDTIDLLAGVSFRF